MCKYLHLITSFWLFYEYSYKVCFFKKKNVVSNLSFSERSHAGSLFNNDEERKKSSVARDVFATYVGFSDDVTDTDCWAQLKWQHFPVVFSRLQAKRRSLTLETRRKIERKIDCYMCLFLLFLSAFKRSREACLAWVPFNVHFVSLYLPAFPQSPVRLGTCSNT